MCPSNCPCDFTNSSMRLHRRIRAHTHTYVPWGLWVIHFSPLICSIYFLFFISAVIMSRNRRFLRGRNAGQVQLLAWSGCGSQQGRKDSAPPAEGALGESHKGGRGLQFQHFQRSGDTDVHQLPDRGLYGCPFEAEWYGPRMHTHTHTRSLLHTRTVVKFHCKSAQRLSVQSGKFCNL